MAELREVFEMVTKQAEPDIDSWRQQERRQRRKDTRRKLGAVAVAAAIGVVAVVVVIRAVDEGTGTRPGGQLTGTTEIPTTQPIPTIPNAVVEPGRYVFTTDDPNLDASYRVTMDVPEGYLGLGGGAILKPGTSQTGVSTWAIGNVYADACQWRGTLLDRSAISSTDDLVAALANQKGLWVSTPTDVTIDGFAGTYMERTFPARMSLTDCDGVQFRVWLDAGGGVRWLGSPGQLDLLWILDVDGAPLVIDVALEVDAPAHDRAELLRMVDSIRIDPQASLG
jgi:hypothetical protein